MTAKTLKIVELGNRAESYITHALADGNVFCHALASRVKNPRRVWTWASVDISEYAPRLEFGGIFSRQEATEICHSLIEFATDYLRHNTGGVLVSLNQLAYPNDPFLQKKSNYFVWENTVNFITRDVDIKAEDVDRCFREKRGSPPVAFLSRAPGIQIADRAELDQRKFIELLEGTTHLIIGIFDEESYLVAQLA